MSLFTSSTCLQFANYTTLYQRCKVKDIRDCANIIQNDVEHLKAWSDVNSLVFNGKKTKPMILSTRQMSRYHNLDNTDTYSVVLNGNEAENRIERNDSMKILGMKVDQHLTWEEQVTNVIKSSYDKLWSLKLLKRYTPYKLRKTAEALILSKIDYVSFVYQKVQKFLIKRLQKVQTISAGYVLNRYAKECDVIKLGWLPIIERFEFNTTKLAFKALHWQEWPGYQPLKFHISNYRVTLKNNDDYKLLYVKDKNTFKYDVYRCVNDLPLDLGKEINNNKFISGAKSVFINKALARLS